MKLNKNNIILIGIIVLFILVIRPLSNKKKEEKETVEQTDTAQKEQPLTYYEPSEMVQTGFTNSSGVTE